MKKSLCILIILSITMTGGYLAAGNDMYTNVPMDNVAVAGEIDAKPLILAGGGGSGGGVSQGGQKEKDCAAIAALAGAYCIAGYYTEPCRKACKDVVDGGCCNTMVAGSINPCMHNDLPDESNCLKQ